MKSIMKKCPNCREYTMKEICPRCGENDNLIPPRFSPEDPYGKYRRMLRKEKGSFKKVVR